MNSKERLSLALNHKASDRVPVDFGSTSVTGIHCKVVEALRCHYDLDKHPVKVIEPFQMLGEIEEDLFEVMGIDVCSDFGTTNMFSIDNTEYHLQKTHWGQEVFIAKDISLEPAADGNVYVYPQGDRSVNPSGVMPEGCYFVNTLERQGVVDDSTLNIEDNIEEFVCLTASEIEHFKSGAAKAAALGRGVVASFGGTALGDIALVPAMGLKNPKGIRGVSEWYMSTVLRADYIDKVFEKQTDIAIKNYEKLWAAIGSNVDVVFTCGTDFGTQDTQFCSAQSFRELWLPHYKRMNDWIHQHTTWKTFKHCCGSIVPLIPSMIDAGFDILNPVQINAKGMDSRMLKSEFGRDLVFWGGVDTQKILPFGTPDEVRRHVIEQREIFGENGGFVFNSVHNVQANVPITNVVAMIDAVKSL